MINTLIINESVRPGQKGEESIKLTLSQSVDFLERMVKPASLQVIEGKAHALQTDNLHSFFKNAFAALNENGLLEISMKNDQDQIEKIKSFTKMTGFQGDLQKAVESNTDLVNFQFVVTKPANKISNGQGPAKIKRKVKELQNGVTKAIAAKINPWANLDSNANESSNLINEDELMKNSEQSSKKIVASFCDIKDKMQGAKPCANCSCGLKERVEGNQTTLEGADQKDLENGNVESSCGSCYLGDAFRCASCPFKGLPAFEKGDKVKLVNNDTNQQSETMESRAKVTVSANNTGSTKVMLNTDDMDMDF